jgi:hypothetical protein
VEGAQTVTTTDRLRWPSALTPGPHWWRVRRPGGGRIAALTWEVFIPEEDSPVPLVGDPRPDFNGDGVIAGTEGGTAWGGCLYGGRCTFTVVSDVNGDGYVDAYTVVRTESPVPGFPSSSLVDIVTRLQFGSSIGLLSQDPAFSTYRDTDAMEAVGDVNGDGYADLLRAQAFDPRSPDSMFRLILGAPEGANELTSFWMSTGLSITAADFNGDGFRELVMTSSGLRATEITVLSDRCALADRCTVPRCGDLDVLGGSSSFNFGSTADFNHDGYPDLQIARFPWGGFILARRLDLARRPRRPHRRPLLHRATRSVSAVTLLVDGPPEDSPEPRGRCCRHHHEIPIYTAVRSSLRRRNDPRYRR